uniref:Ig-like domain-containing protein n=1 Tax=Denticeps clupeoides TaxID=299321 RepID=A0AAY4AHL3_9TELE
MFIYYYKPLNDYAFLSGDILGDEIKPNTTDVFAEEGSDVILSCESSTIPSGLFWYRQYPRSAPQFLVVVYSAEKDQISEVSSRVLGKMKGKTQTLLEISSAAVSDSALYYCAMRPTVTGTHGATYKNLLHGWKH